MDLGRGDGAVVLTTRPVCSGLGPAARAVPVGQMVCGLVGAPQADKRAANLGPVCAGRLPGVSRAGALHPGATAGPAPGHVITRAARGGATCGRGWAVEEGKQQYKRRAGVEGTLSQAVRSYGLRSARYGGRNLQSPTGQHVATAAALNIDRLVAWLISARGRRRGPPALPR